MLLDYALPPRCPGCGAMVDAQHAFCLACWRTLDFLTPPWCAGCGVPLPHDLGPDACCAACLAKRPRHDGARAAVAYGDVARRVALRLKYGGRIGLADLIAQHLERFVDSDARPDLIVPVPLHWTRLWGRGFNQAALIGAALGRRTGVAQQADCLMRVRRTPPLWSMNPRQRQRTMAGAIRLRPRREAQVKGKAILLVDDILTSGATADACARALKWGGARSVTLLVWARALKDGAERAKLAWSPHASH